MDSERDGRVQTHFGTGIDSRTRESQDHTTWKHIALCQANFKSCVLHLKSFNIKKTKKQTKPLSKTQLPPTLQKRYILGFHKKTILL